MPRGQTGRRYSAVLGDPLSATRRLDDSGTRRLDDCSTSTTDTRTDHTTTTTTNRRRGNSRGKTRKTVAPGVVEHMQTGKGRGLRRLCGRAQRKKNPRQERKAQGARGVRHGWAHAAAGSQGLVNLNKRESVGTRRPDTSQAEKQPRRAPAARAHARVHTQPQAASARATASKGEGGLRGRLA